MSFAAPTAARSSDPSAIHRRVLIPTVLPRTLPLGGGAPARPVWTFSGTTMGTYWRARIVARPPDSPASAGEARRCVVDAFARVVALMSPWEAGSDLARFAAASPGEWIPLAPETATVLGCALEVAEASSGAYDPTVGGVVDLLGFGPSDPAKRLPLSSPEVRAARASVGFDKLVFDSARPAARQPGGQRLDLCSIAKGYAVDLASERLHAAGWTDHFLEIGGEARGRGCKPDGQPWWCAIEGPAHVPPTVAALCELSAATSGETLRRYDDPSGSVGHLIPVGAVAASSPGRPLHSVTVLAESCMEADAWATALYVLGTEAGLALASSRRLAARWAFLESDPALGDEVRTPAFESLLS